MKLTSKLLRRIVEEEAAKFKRDTPEKAAKDTEETDASDYADTLEKHVDALKAYKIEEARLVKRYKRIQEIKRAIVKKLAK